VKYESICQVIKDKTSLEAYTIVCSISANKKLDS
jgi:hypothetical protein